MESVLDIADGIKVIDSGYIRQEMVAIYLLRQGDKIAIIETGTKYSIPKVRQALEKDGLNFSNVAYVIPTHVHLDHAAGAGELMKLCPNAQLVIHPRGARHMADPSKLIAGTVAVYGEEKFNQLYGDIVPIDSSRIIEADDNFVLDFDGRELKFIDTPGHARHHFCIWDRMTESMFTGDTFGISYRDFDNGDEIYIFPTTTPIQFDPYELINSVNKLMKYKPKRICLTHFGAIKPKNKVVEQLIDGINFMSSLGIEYAAQDNAEEKIQNAMMDYFLQELQKMGFTDQDSCREKLKFDVELNTQGLIYWQQKIASG